MTGRVIACYLIIVTLALSCATSAAAEPYNEGRQAYEAGDYATAMALWKPIAEAGEPWAQYAIANLYMEGLGVGRNLVAGIYWLERAATEGLSLAQLRLGQAYSEGYGVDKDDAEAVKWWRYAADQGVVDAMYNLGVHYYFGHGVEKDRDRAFDWLEKAADAGHEQAQNIVMVEQAGRAGELAENQAAEPEEAAPEEPEVEQANTEVAAASNPIEPEPASVAIADPVVEVVAREEERPAPDVSAEIEKTANGQYDERWILAKPPEHFTLQLAVMTDDAGVTRYLDKHGIEGEIAVFPRVGGGIVIILGDYFDRAEAESARETLPAAVRKQSPWPRPFADIITIMKSR